MILIYVLLISGGAVKVDEYTYSQGVRINYKLISELEMNELEISEEHFIRFSLLGVGILSDVGKPELPVIREFVQIPEGAELSIETKVGAMRELSLRYPVYPKQAPVPKIPGYKPEFTIDRDYYTIDEFLPEVRARIINIGEIRGHRIAMIEVYPVQYNPYQNVIRFVKEIKVTISFNGANWTATRSKLERYCSPYYENRLRTIVNYEYYKQQIKPPIFPTGYLIITPDSWYNSILPLADWKKQKGYYVTVAKLSQTGSSTNEILDYIKDAYNNWPVPPTFVLLVGDVDQIGYWTGQGIGNPSTDLNYSLMNAGDYFPDIDLSRFSVATQVQLDSLVDKTIRYEKNNWTQGTDWCNKMYFIASSDASGHSVAEGTHQYCMEKARALGVICDSLWLYYSSGTPLPNAINDGRSWVMYSGHGSTDRWADCGFTVGDVHNLTNTDKPAFVGTYACLSGDYVAGECFSESWVRSGRRAGIADFASSVISYWDEDDILQRRMFDAAFDSGATWVMGMLNKSKLLLYAYYGDIPIVRRYFEMYNMMGDGSIDAYWDIPHTLTVVHPSTISIGTFSLPVTVTDGGSPVESALVCAKRDTIFVGYTNSSGQVTLNGVNPTPCTLTITVTGHNLQTYQGICQVVGTGVIYLKHSIDDDSTGPSSGNGDGVVDAGEIIELPLWVKNYGSTTINGVEGKLSTADAFVTIMDSLATFGNIGAGDSAISSSSYVFEVDVNVPDNHVVAFDLTCKDNLDSIWVSYFYILIRHYIAVTLVSPNGGETWDGNSTHPIRWSTVGVGVNSYRLLFSPSPDSEWDTVACSISSPHPYSNNFDSTWLISHPGAEKIKVHFSSFETELNYDTVYLYDKNDSVIVYYHGNIGPFWAQEVTGDIVKVRLVTDYSGTCYGFDIDKYTTFHSGVGYTDTIAANVSADSSSWDWTLPNINCTTAKVKIEVMNNLSNVIAEDESDSFFTIIKVSTEDVIFLPNIYDLSQVYPNPFLKRTVIRYQIPVKSNVSLQIYDVGGRLVKTLVDEEKQAGYYQIVWDTKDDTDKRLPSGIYFYRLSVSDFVATKKLILIR